MIMFFYVIPAIFLFFFVISIVAGLVQNEPVETIKFIGLQGSASYLIKDLNLEGQLIPIDDLATFCTDHIRDIKSNLPPNFNIQSLANYLMAILFVSIVKQEHPSVQYVFSMRSIPSKSKGAPLSTQLFASWCRANPTQTHNKIVLELGSGQIKVCFNGQRLGEIDIGNFWEASASYEIEDANEYATTKLNNMVISFIETYNTSDGTPIIDVLSKLMPDLSNDCFNLDIKNDKLFYIFGTALLRKMPEEFMASWHRISQAEEQWHESNALLTAIQDPDANIPAFYDSTDKSIVWSGQFAWGCGSCQGEINSIPLEWDFGLNKIMGFFEWKKGDSKTVNLSHDALISGISNVSRFFGVDL